MPTLHTLRAALLRTTAAALLALGGEAARAAPSFEAVATSNLGVVYILRSSSLEPINAFDDGCVGPSCGSAALIAGGGTLGVLAQVASGPSAQPFDVRAGVSARGALLIVGAGPAFVDTSMRLEFSGRADGSAGAGNAGGAVGLTAQIEGAAGAGGSGAYKEFYGYGTGAAAAPIANGIRRVDGSTLLLEHLRLPVNVPFELALSLGAEVGTVGQGYSLIDYSHTAGPARSGAVFDLPAGLTAQSADWGIVDNAWCPDGCISAPVPEPAPFALALAGLALIGLRRAAAGAPRGCAS